MNIKMELGSKAYRVQAKGHAKGTDGKIACNAVSTLVQTLEIALAEYYEGYPTKSEEKGGIINTIITDTAGKILVECEGGKGHAKIYVNTDEMKGRKLNDITIMFAMINKGFELVNTQFPHAFTFACKYKFNK